MNVIKSTYRQLGIPAVFVLLSSVAGACASDGDPPSTSKGGSSNAGSGGSTGGSTGGSAPTTGGSTASGGSAGGSATGGSSSGGTSASGGTNASGGAGGAKAPSVCDGKTTVAKKYIGDFEDFDTAPPTGWFAYVEATPSTIAAATPGAVETAKAAGFSGGAAKYAGMGFGLGCKDVSALDGISFWAKASTEGAKIKFLAAIPATDAVKEQGGTGDCTAKCFDHPGKALKLTTAWKQYTVKWSDLEQDGFGAPATFDNIVNVLLWINDGEVTSFDFSIDEVSLYAGTPPAGAVGTD
jgi:hypothetical protein